MMQAKTLTYAVATAVMLIAGAAAPAAAQGRALGRAGGTGGQGTGSPGSPGTPGNDDPAVTPFQLQRLFDSYALVEAQKFLGLNDEQYPRFLPKFMALQETRRQALQQRTRVITLVRRLLADSQSDEGMLRDALKQLPEIDTRGAAEARKAYDAIDLVLDLRQQAKFRVFEEQMERRKLELVTRARQANRQNRQQQ
jgi:hypothetical protein